MDERKQQINLSRAGRVFAGPCVPRGEAVVCAFLVLVALPLVGWGADLQVRVMSRETGRVVPNVSVCLGTPADPSQLGARRTPGDGTVLFRDVPRAPLILTVSGVGYRPEERRLSALDHNAVMVVQVTTGGGPPVGCEAPPLERARGFVVPGFRINAGADSTGRRRVTLNFVVPDGVTEYRASESPEFPDAQWREIRRAPTFELSPGEGTKTVYLQLRRYREVEGARLETRSRVAADSIRLR